MKVCDLIGPALDWAVATAVGYLSKQGDLWMVQLPVGDTGRVTPRMNWVPGPKCVFTPSTRWAHGGPIIEREMITVGPAKHQGYMAWAWPKDEGYWGDTPLIAAMRCYVASKLGDEIHIPAELL